MILNSSSIALRVFWVSDDGELNISTVTSLILRIKEVTVEIFNSPSSETQNILIAILEELRIIRNKLDEKSDKTQIIPNHLQDNEREVA